MHGLVQRRMLVGLQHAGVPHPHTRARARPPPPPPTTTHHHHHPTSHPASASVLAGTQRCWRGVQPDVGCDGALCRWGAGGAVLLGLQTMRHEMISMNLA